MIKARWLLPVLLAVPLLAVTPSFWEVRTYDDFQQGKLSNLSLTSDDRLILAPRYDLVFDTQQTLIASAVADSKGNVYLGTGHEGKIYKVDPSGQGTMIADLNELDIFALAVDSKDAIYAGTSPNGKVYKIEAGGTPKEFFDPGTKYIWSMVFDKQGRLLVGTGDKGVIYRVGSDGKGAPFYDTDETHIVTLAIDRDGNVIAGGDPKGYLYRISPEGKAFVLYDSGLREVHAVSVAADGRIYAAVVNGEAGSSPSMTAPGKQSSPTTIEGEGITVTIGASASAAQAVEIAADPAGADSVSPTPGPSSGRGAGSGPSQSVILEVLPNGTVNTLWRLKNEMVYGLLPHSGRLLFSTGTKGRIYSIDNSRNTTLLVESTEEQTTRLLEVGTRVYATSANTGKLFGLSDAVAATGSYESVVRDTNAVSTWGTMSWKADLPTQIQFLTRTGNTGVPDKTWSDWARVSTAGAVTSPPARFAQWRAVLTAAAGNASAAIRATPSLDSVTLPYLQQNFGPELTSIDVLPPGVALEKVPPMTLTGAPAPTDPALIRANIRAGIQPAGKAAPRRSVEKGAQAFKWTATDRNQDVLVYDIYYRGESERTWKLLKKGLEDNFYTIDSDALPDGTYVLRVVASDLPSNPPATALTAELESRPFSIDNTPPTVRIQQSAITAGRVRVAIDAADATSTLNQAEISVDTGRWQALFPTDGITDSKSESYVYQTDVLTPGEHVVAFRIYDQNDNVGIGKLIVRIP